MPWADNDNFVAPDRSIFTLRKGGIVEMRGPGWDQRKRGDPPLADRPRILKLWSKRRARRILNMVIEMVYGPESLQK